MNPLLRPDHLLKDLRSLDAVLSPRAAAANRWLELPLLVSALAVAPMFIIELVATGGWTTGAVIINWFIWAAFTTEFAVLFGLTEHRRAYLRKAWLHLLVIPFAFPLLADLSSNPTLQTTLRGLRFLVLLAVLIQSGITLYRVLKHSFFDLVAVASHPWIFFLGPLLRSKGLGLVAVVFLVVAVTAGLLHALFEDRHPLEGMWWALVTLTTVGYGDITPVTVGGRITAAMLMLSGIGILSFTTATVAAYFVEGDYREELHSEVRSINRRLDRIEELLASLKASDQDRH